MLTIEQKRLIDSLIAGSLEFIKDLIKEGDIKNDSPSIMNVKEKMIEYALAIFTMLDPLEKTEVTFYIEKRFDEMFPNA